MFATYFDATDWSDTIPSQLGTEAWQQSRRQATAWAQWNAYLNQLCLEGCLQFLQAAAWPNAATPVVGMDRAQADRTWAVVNGAVIRVGDRRVVLIPAETIDQSELEVPQEWVDVPSWAADYYLAVYLTPDMQQWQIAGYATHQQIKQQAQLNISSRNYYLDVADLTTDLNLLGLTIGDYGTAQTRGAIAATATLGTEQATNLVQRLGAATELWPRLEVPFAVWAALLDNPTWHEQLYRQRQGEAMTGVMMTRLAGWMQGQFDRAWQAAEQVLAPQQIAIATRSTAAETIDATIRRVKVIAVGDGQVGLLVNLTPVNEREMRIDLQIHPTGESIHLPGETQVRLLSLEGTEIAQAKAAVTETIRLQFRANYGEAFQLEISCNGQVRMEQFEL
jgi:Protein of unknown function (DUF1822)